MGFNKYGMCSQYGIPAICCSVQTIQYNSTRRANVGSYSSPSLTVPYECTVKILSLEYDLSSPIHMFGACRKYRHTSSSISTACPCQ